MPRRKRRLGNRGNRNSCRQLRDGVKLGFESLEQRNLLAVIAWDTSYETPAGHRIPADAANFGFQSRFVGGLRTGDDVRVTASLAFGGVGTPDPDILTVERVGHGNIIEFRGNETATVTFEANGGSETLVVRIYDLDGDVDGADFLEWQRSYGSTTNLTADGNLDGVVNAADYTVRRDNFGFVPQTAGDYDGDGDVDGADFLTWQRGYGSTTNLAADGNRNGVVDAADYTIWRDNFGAGSRGTTSAVASVPEPSGCCLVLGLLSVAAAGRVRCLINRRFDLGHRSPPIDKTCG